MPVTLQLTDTQTDRLQRLNIYQKTAAEYLLKGTGT